MNMKRFLLCVVVGFVFVFLYEFVVHGVLLKPIYEATAALWRSEEDMKSLCPYGMLVSLAFVSLVACIFVKNYEAKGFGEGVRFGFLLGLLMGLIPASFYLYMPIPGTLALAWFFASFVETIGLGILFAFIYRKPIAA